MEALDAANRKFGKRAVVVVASMGCPSTLRGRGTDAEAPAWEMRRERMSPRYTTRWDELVAVRLGSAPRSGSEPSGSEPSVPGPASPGAYSDDVVADECLQNRGHGDPFGRCLDLELAVEVGREQEVDPGAWHVLAV